MTIFYELKKNHKQISHFLDDRRRGGRIRPTEDNRRHTLGSHNDMLVYSQQNQNIQQRAMDLEVNISKKIFLFLSLFHFKIQTILLFHFPISLYALKNLCSTD